MAHTVSKKCSGAVSSSVLGRNVTRSYRQPIRPPSNFNDTKNRGIHSQTTWNFESVSRSVSERSRPATVARIFGSRQFRLSVCSQPARSASQTPTSLSSAATVADVPKEYLKYPLPDDCQLLALPDGRHMAYSEYGSKAHDAHPFIFIHGIPDTRLDACLLSSDVAIAEKLNIRWIGIDRPGIGLSTFQPNRTVLGWVDDLQSLLRHLKLTRYRIFSVSGGTPYALACAKLLPRKELLSVAIAMGVGPKGMGKAGLSTSNRVGLWIWENYPWIFATIFDRYIVPKVHQDSQEGTEDIVRQSIKYMTKADQDALQGEEIIQGVVDITREVYRQGSSKGYVEDSKLATGYWGYELEDVKYEGIRLFYGKLDVNTPPAMGRYMAAHLPEAVLKEYEGKSHFTMWDHFEEMLTDMLEDTRNKEVR